MQFPPNCKEGRFASAGQVTCAGLRLLEEQELKVENLRNAIIKGEESGEPMDFDMSAFIEACVKSSRANGKWAKL